MADFVATRNTCFALISAIEDDFRALIAATVTVTRQADELLPTDVREVALIRRASDRRMDSIALSVQDVELLPYIDFADIAKVLGSRLAPKLDREREWLLLTAQQLVALTPVRNRVCHTRPLEPDDLPMTLDFARSMVGPAAPFQFQAVLQAISRLRDDPGFVLTLQIPTFWSVDLPRIHHNLPVPEFDETGFLGRTVDRLQVMRLLKSHYPVVTIVGEGGIGKTALALRCLYDLIEDHACQFEAIVWISMKSAALTSTGVKELTGVISSTLGLLSGIATQLGTPDSRNRTESELIDEIAEYLDLYRIMIAIDNLETLSTGSLRDLLTRIPAHSKILLTSRVGVGEFEARYPLQGLDEKTSSTLLRSYARLLRIDELAKTDEGTVRGYCKRLFHNPLLIKWFVSSVGRGLEPSRLLKSNVDQFSEALSFCFDNLFDRFGKPERTVIDCLASARKSLSSAEIHYLCPQLSSVEAEVALSALHNSSIVTRSKTVGDGSEYSLSESALRFLNAKAPPSAEFFKAVQGKMRDLRLVLAQEATRESRYDYDPYFVRSGANRDERICATYLRNALDSLRRRDFGAARLAVAESKRLAAGSCEAWRIGALVEEDSGELFIAVENYEQAVGLDPQSKIARYCYGMFLLSDMEDSEGALIQFEYGLQLDPGAPPFLTAKAMALTRLHRFEESAGIHDILLPQLKNRERRWRITGTDQAADCYRRWGHREWEKREYGVAKQKFQRALSILLDAAERGDIDDKLLQRVAKVGNEALSKRELKDDDFVEYVISTLEKIAEVSSSVSIPVTADAAWALKNLEANESYCRRLLALDRSNANRNVVNESSTMSKSSMENSRSPDTQRGTVHNVADRGSYGFIIDANDDRWFFHANFLRVPSDWPNLTVGSTVSFRIGQNAKGLCAVDVCRD